MQGVYRSQIYTMKLATRLNGHSYRFSGVAEVLAKASEPKSGDRLIGIAAQTATERLAAKVVLSELTVGDLTENPTVPYEQDEVTRVNWEGLNQPGYQSMKNLTIGELREWVLDHKTTPRCAETFRPQLCGRGGLRSGADHDFDGPGPRHIQDPVRHTLQYRDRPSRNHLLSRANQLDYLRSGDHCARVGRGGFFRL